MTVMRIRVRATGPINHGMPVTHQLIGIDLNSPMTLDLGSQNHDRKSMP